ncbi:hypothetical protein QVD17_40602 [Tagetes erecta]|uniref:Uncharacterized protein n=1 Tax=Tagetes erecta TaxID=13708 RepID=A0AAD8JTZ8_TARER|nr:hypothetical protein QVD17_40602 [Tagetes erecta]
MLIDFFMQGFEIIMCYATQILGMNRPIAHAQAKRDTSRKFISCISNYVKNKKAKVEMVKDNLVRSSRRVFITLHKFCSLCCLMI